MNRVTRISRWMSILVVLAVVPFGTAAPQAPSSGPPASAGDTLTVSEVVRTALSQSPAIAAGRARVSAEGAGRWADWGSLLPTLHTSADFARIEGNVLTFEGEEGVARQASETIEFVRKGARQSAFLDWKLLDGGRRYFRLKEGAAREKAAVRRLGRRQRQVAARVKRLYFEALEQQQLVATWHRQLEARRAELRRTRDRYEAGSVGRLDLLGAKKELREARVRLLGARSRAADRIRRLQAEMGVDVSPAASAPRLAPVEPPRPAELETDRLVERAISSDPELRALAAEAAAASAASGASWTRYLPEIRLSYGQIRSEVGGPEASFLNFSPRDDFNQVALSVSWDLFRGFERREVTARARAEEREARARHRARRLELERRVRSRVQEIRQRDERLDALRESLEMARERLDLARMRYEANQMAFDRYQTFIDDVTAAERTFHDERAAYLTAWAELEEVVGEVHFPAGG